MKIIDFSSGNLHEAYTLFLIAEQSIKETAPIYGASELNVEICIHRAKEKLNIIFA